LCNTSYVVLYDPIKKANIFSSEKISAQGVAYPSSGSFRADQRLRVGERAENSDYLYSIYDRGHMTPADDMYTLEEMRSSFLLSNVTPQNRNLNRGAWRVLEQKIKENKTGTIYILTGASYSITPKTIGLNKIPVPSAYYKCVWYDDVKVDCYTAKNISYTQVINISLTDTFTKVGIK